ncbi:MAG: hypothetical protein LBN04_03580, partial [Oscillospiraceae bacterium]|nr:hypothetical protein [Oscillospiraceae bacterium]
ALKVIAEVEIMVPSYGFCTIPPSEEFAENVCDEFFSLPLYPPATQCDPNTVVSGCGSAVAGNTCSSGSCGSGCGTCGNTMWGGNSTTCGRY